VYEDIRFVPIQVLLIWCSTEDIGVSSRLVPTKLFLIWFSTKEIGVSSRTRKTVKKCQNGKLFFEPVE
jgi:hypothetical protein